MNQQMHNALESLGNGNVQAGVELLYKIGGRLSHARAKHPVFAEGKFQALGVVGAEYVELTQAVEKETPERQKDEALDVIATSVRLWLGEHDTTPSA